MHLLYFDVVVVMTGYESLVVILSREHILLKEHWSPTAILDNVSVLCKTQWEIKVRVCNKYKLEPKERWYIY